MNTRSLPQTIQSTDWHTAIERLKKLTWEEKSAFVGVIVALIAILVMLLVPSGGESTHEVNVYYDGRLGVKLFLKDSATQLRGLPYPYAGQKELVILGNRENDEPFRLFGADQKKPEWIQVITTDGTNDSGWVRVNEVYTKALVRETGTQKPVWVGPLLGLLIPIFLICGRFAWIGFQYTRQPVAQSPQEVLAEEPVGERPITIPEGAATIETVIVQDADPDIPKLEGDEPFGLPTFEPVVEKNEEILLETETLVNQE